MSKVEAADRQFVTALSRGLDILRCFDTPRIELTVSDIARRVGLQQPTVWRLCHTLIERGFLVRSPNGAALRIGAPALTLGYAAIQGQDVPALALPYMRDLTAKSGGSTTLSLFQNAEMISVERCDGDILLPNQPIGWRASPSSGPSGLAVMALLPDADRRDVEAAIQARDPQQWPRRQARIETAMAGHARDGFVILDGMMDQQYAAAAIALVEGSGEATRYWAVSCGGLRSRMTPDRLVEAGRALLALKGLLQPALAALTSDRAALRSAI